MNRRAVCESPHVLRLGAAQEEAAPRDVDIALGHRGGEREVDRLAGTVREEQGLLHRNTTWMRDAEHIGALGKEEAGDGCRAR